MDLLNLLAESRRLERSLARRSARLKIQVYGTPENRRYLQLGVCCFYNAWNFAQDLTYFSEKELSEALSKNTVEIFSTSSIE